MNQNDAKTINSSEMEKVILEINNKITYINNNLTRIKELTNSDSFGICGDLEEIINSKFNEINNNFPIVIQNLEVIVDELMSCQTNYKLNDEVIAEMLRGQELK